MVNDCKKLNLNIQQEDALLLLVEFSKNSFSIVSTFHVIEEMNHENINALLIKCKRILKPDGLLFLETPNIDNLIVSSKSFYVDPTHINPIHSDLLAFMIKRASFIQFKYYFINGLPLQNSEADLLTRVFNCVSQDLVLIGSKSDLLDNSIFDTYSRNRYAQYDEAIFRVLLDYMINFRGIFTARPPYYSINDIAFFYK